MEADATLLEGARVCLARGEHLQALELFLKTFKHHRQWYGAHVREQFYAALSGTLDKLQLGDASDIERFTGIVREVVCVCGGDGTPLKMLGMKCLIEGAYPQAQCLLQAVLQIDPECLSTRESLRTVFDHLVNRWHFRMLNDIRRNSAYWEAIGRAVGRVPCCSILDIGTGTGILSMMATKAGAGRVYACEVNETMLALSRDIIAANGMNDITLSHAYSTNLSIPKDIPERVHLVVTETVDAGLLGECIIPSLRHAWRELLLPRRSEDLPNQMAPSGQVIPCGATVYIMAIECSQIQKHSQLLSTVVGGVDFSGVVLEGSCKAARGTEGVRGGARDLEREPYTCERLTHISGGYRTLTEAHKALHFDFTNPEIPLPLECHLKLPVVEKGRVDALVMWFDLHLDATVWLSTRPAWESCWEQAVYPIRRQNTSVGVGDSVLIRASCSEVSVDMEVAGIERVHETGVDGSDDSMRETEEDTRRNLGPCLIPSTGGGETLLGESAGAMVTEDSTGCGAATAPVMVVREPLSVFVERGELLRLNDTVYVEAYRRAIAGAIAAVRRETSDSSDSELEEDMSRMVLDGGEEGTRDGGVVEGDGGGSSREEMSDGEEGGYADCAVLDVCEGMSVCGLMATREGADFVQIGRVHQPYHTLLEQVAKDNGMEDRISLKWLELSRIAAATPPMWDLIVCDVISPQGTLHTAVLEELSHMRSQLCHAGSVMVVSSITLCVTALSSPELRAHASVLGTVPTLGFNIAEFINQYQVAHFIDLDLSVFPHSTLTDDQEVLTVDFDSLGRQPLKMKQCVSLNVKSAGSLTAIAYWFILHLFGDITIATGPGSYQGSHWHQAAFLLPEDITVYPGQQLSVLVTLQDSCIDITVQGPS